MSVSDDGDVIRLVGDAPAEDAEALAALLLAVPGRPVDWSRSRRLHAAVVQVLLAFRPSMAGTPEDAFSRRWLAPLLQEQET